MEAIDFLRTFAVGSSLLSFLFSQTLYFLFVTTTLLFKIIFFNHGEGHSGSKLSLKSTPASIWTSSDKAAT